MLDWSDEFLIGDARVDQEHKMLLDLMSQFSTARANNASLEELIAAIGEMVLFARFHFLREENMLRRLGFSGVEDHRRKHCEIIDSLTIQINALATGQKTPLELEKYYLEWFIKHVTDDDVEFIAHLGSKSS